MLPRVIVQLKLPYNMCIICDFRYLFGRTPYFIFCDHCRRLRFVMRRETKPRVTTSLVSMRTVMTSGRRFTSLRGRELTVTLYGCAVSMDLRTSWWIWRYYHGRTRWWRLLVITRHDQGVKIKLYSSIIRQVNTTVHCQLVTVCWLKTAPKTLKIDLASISMVSNFRKKTS